jgi:hypothetical protein
VSGRGAYATAAAALALGLLAAGAARGQAGRRGGPGTVLLPVEGERAVGRIEQELQAAFARRGHRVQRSELKLEDLMLAAGCAEPDAACLKKIGASVGARALILGRAEPAGGGRVKLTLRRFEVLPGRDAGRAEVLLPRDAGARAPLLADAAGRLTGPAQARLRPTRPPPPPPTDQSRSGTLSISSSVPAVELVLDGQPRGSLPVDLRDLPPGRYRIQARKPGYKPWDETREVFPGETTYVTVKLEAQAPQAARSFFGSIRWPTWVVGGAGLASLVAGAGFGGHALSQQSSFDKIDPSTYDDIRRMEELRDSGQSSALTANILFGVGGAALVAAGVMAYFDYRKAKTEQQPALGKGPELVLGPGTIQVWYSF